MNSTKFKLLVFSLAVLPMFSVGIVNKSYTYTVNTQYFLVGENFVKSA